MSYMFAQRSCKKELLDEPIIPRDDLYRNLKELHTINRLLGGYEVIHSGLRELMGPKSRRTLKILDIGSGGGDTLKSIERKFSKHYDLVLTGVDIKLDCVEYARRNCQGKNIKFIQSDYRALLTDNQEYDIIIASLFCHHLSDDEIEKLLRWICMNAKVGVIINDLHRHFLAYYSIKWLTKLFSSSYLVKNDAPLSVLRSFRRSDWKAILDKGGIQNYTLKWKWAFRWLLYIELSEHYDV